MAIQLEDHEKKWLKNVFFYLGKQPKPSSAGMDTEAFNQVSSDKMRAENADTAWEDLHIIITELDTRAYNIKINDAIRSLASTTYYYDSTYGRYTGLSAKQISDAIAAMCAKNKITWNPAGYSDDEIYDFDTSMFGFSLAEAEAVESGTSSHNTAQQSASAAASQQAPQTQPQSVKQKRTPTVYGGVGVNGRPLTHGNSIKGSVHSRAVAKKDPAKTISSYKGAGPLGNYVRDVQGTKRDIVPDQHGYIYRIEAHDSKTSGNTPVAFIKPLTIDLADREGKMINIAAKNEINGTNKVFMGSAHGYPEAALYWDDLSEADAFLGKLLASNRIPSKIDPADIKVHALEIKGAIAKITPHKFYPVNTELGPALICANMLNESLAEAFEASGIECVRDEDTCENETTAEETKVYTTEEFRAWAKENINWD